MGFSKRDGDTVGVLCRDTDTKPARSCFLAVSGKWLYPTWPLNSKDMPIGEDRLSVGPDLQGGFPRSISLTMYYWTGYLSG